MQKAAITHLHPNSAGKMKELKDMKEYIIPIINVIYCYQEDIITSSSNQFDNIGDDINWIDD